MEPMALNSFDLDETKSMPKTEHGQRILFITDDEAQLKRECVEARKLESRMKLERPRGNPSPGDIVPTIGSFSMRRTTAMAFDRICEEGRLWKSRI